MGDYSDGWRFQLVRLAPEGGSQSDIAPCPLSAKSGHFRVAVHRYSFPWVTLRIY
jgi:hypothetical protein